MKFTVILAVLFAITMVTMANRMNKLKKLKKKAHMAKMEDRQQAACDVVSWGLCENGQITQTVSPNTTNPACKGPIINEAVIQHTMMCVTQTNNTMRGCEVSITRNYTTCQNNGETYSLKKTFNCAGGKKKGKNDMEIQKPCGIRIREPRGHGAAGGMGKGKGGARGGARKAKKEFRKKLGALKKQGCVYEKSACVENQMKWALKTGDSATCEAELTGPCLGIFKNKKGNRRQRGASACKYKGEPWSDCDPVTNLKTKRRVLKRGDPSSCNETVFVEKPCKRQPRPLRGSKECKYKKGQWSSCDPITNEKTMIKTLKRRGKAASCPPTQTVKKVCKRKLKNTKARKCAYKALTKWGKCDRATNTRSRKTILKKGKLKFCKPTMIETKPCKKKRTKPNKGCKYNRNQWSPCDAATNTVTRTLTLKEGDPTICNASKTITRKCKDKHLRPHLCVYRRTTWGECEGANNMVSMVKTLKRGDPSLCEPTKTVQRKCKRKKGKMDGTACKYSKAEWSDCDQAANTVTKTQTLVSGPSSCPAMKEFSKKCKKPCKFSQGRWSECDLETQQLTREDTLSNGDPSVCPPKRILTKKCGKKAKKCHYDTSSTWTECDSSEKPVRTRTQKLISGGENCKPEKITTKSCKKNSGKDRCFFGPWSDYDDCKNGVQKKRRQVLQGGLDCERKGVKMKAC